MKARLWDETDVFPAVVLGINDLVGTGVYSGEYLVASKRFGPFDATLGMGWGRLGTTDLFKNPLIHISASFANRSSLVLSTPGSANLNSFFHGPDVGLFGGVVWHTPIDNFSLILEYSSDKYLLERAEGDLTTRGQLNFGASYRMFDNISLGLGWLYGTTLNGSITFLLNPVTAQRSALAAGAHPYPGRAASGHRRVGSAARRASECKRAAVFLERPECNVRCAFCGNRRP
jgi:hypothetical protein